MIFFVDSADSESDSSSIDSVCVYLFDLFRNVNQIQVSHLKELKLRFPTYTQQLVTQTFDLIRSLIKSLKPEFSEDYLLPTISKSSSKPLFGETTVFHPVTLQINEPVPWSDRLSYDVAYQEQEKQNIEETIEEVLPSGIPSIASSSSIYTKKWLEDRLRVVLKSRDNKGDLGQQEFCNLVFETLVSNQIDDEIQHSLCDIIGYDHLELIGELIQNRQMIINGILNSAKARPREIIRAPELIQRQTQPVHGPTIVVQSAEEKRLEKQFRKQDRRLQQQSPQQSDDGLDEYSNPELLRYERERQLLVATAKRYEKLSNSGSSQTNIKYPFVFDQLQEIKQKTAYIGGVNLLLPENIERKSTNAYDLVHIPYGEQIKLANLGKNICSKLIQFEDLEPLGQILFKDSVKTLNLVQSIVYKTAAFSNENILISAP
jgi:activating signal cointegrator complex subunit 3